MKEALKFWLGILLMALGPLLFVGMVADWYYPVLAQNLDAFNHISSALISFTIATVVIFFIEMLVQSHARFYRCRFVVAVGGAVAYQVISESGLLAIMGDPDFLDSLYGALAIVPGLMAGQVFAQYAKRALQWLSGRQ